jgi:hypothetical protein
MLLLDDSSLCALVVDPVLPLSHSSVHDALVQTWPRLSGRAEFLASGLDDIELRPTDVVVSSHACGDLTDRVLEQAAEAGAHVAVMPCCHDLVTCDTGGLSGWMDGSLAIDVVRAQRLAQRGYRIWTLAIPATISPKHRLLLGAPRPGSDVDQNEPDAAAGVSRNDIGSGSEACVAEPLS